MLYRCDLCLTGARAIALRFDPERPLDSLAPIVMPTEPDFASGYSPGERGRLWTHGVGEEASVVTWGYTGDYFAATLTVCPRPPYLLPHALIAQGVQTIHLIATDPYGRVEWDYTWPPA